MSSRDRRIVEMQFDNAAFEKGAAKSMSTLQKLKESLDFTKSANSVTDSFTSIKSEFEGLNNTVTSAADTFKNVFLGTLAGQTAYKGVVAGFNLIKKGYDATIGQIISGGKRRAQNIEQAKFQLGGLGINWDDIYEDLDYAVAGTAYGLDAAAKVGSQFVASGVKLGDDMKAALRGISGVAAMTNSSYEEIGNIFTTVAGQGKLMTMQLNQLASRGLNVAGTLAEAFGTTEANIRDMVTHGEIDFNTFATAMNDAFGEHATKANDTFSGSLSNMKAALSRIGALFATPAYDNLRTVINATTPVINAFKKAITPVADEVGKLMKVAADLAATLLNKFDTSVFDKVMQPIAAFVSMITDSISAISDTVTSSKVEEAADAIKKFSEAEKQAARDIWIWGTYGDGEVRKKRLKEAGLEYANVQEYLEKYVMTCNEAAYEEAIAAENAEEVAKTTTEAGKIIRNAKWYSVFRGLGLNEDTAHSIVNIIETVRNLGIVVKNVFTSIGNVVTAAISGILGYSGYEELTGNVEDISLKMAALSEKFVITKEKAKPITVVFQAITKAVVKTVTVIAKLINNLTLAKKDFEQIVKYGNAASLQTSGGFGSIVKVLGTIGSAFKDIINAGKEFIDTVMELDSVKSLKSTIASVSDTLYLMFHPLETHAGGNGDEISVATAEVNTLSSALDTLVPILAHGVDELTKSLSSFISKIPSWAAAVKNFFEEAFSGDGDNNYLSGKTVLDVIKDLIANITNLFSRDKTKTKKDASVWAENTFSGIIEGVKNAISGFNWEAFEKFSLFSGILIALYKFNDAIKSINTSITNITKLPTTISKTFQSIGKFFTTMSSSAKKLTDAGAISVVALSVAALVMSLTYLADVPVDALARAVVYVILIMEALKSVVAATAKLGAINIQNQRNNMDLGNNNVFKIFDPIISLGVMLFGLATAIGVVYFVIKDFDTMDPETVNDNIARVAIVIGMILGSITALVIILRAFSIDRIPASFIVTIGVVAASIAGVMLAMAGAGALLSVVDADKLKPIVAGLLGFLAILAAIIGLTALVGFSGIRSDEILSIAAVIFAAGLAISIMCGGLAAIVLASKDNALSIGVLETVMPWLEIMLATVVVALGAGALMLEHANNINSTDMEKLAFSILIASSSFAIIAWALSKVVNSVSKTSDLVAATVTIGLLVAGVAAMLYAFAYFSKSKHIRAEEMIKYAAAIAIMAGVLVVTAAAFALIGKISTDMWTAVKAVGLALASIVIIAYIGQNMGRGIERIASALLMFAASGLIFAASVWLFAKAIDALSVALPAFAEGLAAFFESLSENKLAVASLIIVIVAFVGILALAIYAAVRWGSQIQAAFDVFIMIIDNFISYWGSLSTTTQQRIVMVAGAVAAGLAAATPTIMEALGQIFIKIMVYLGVLVGPLVNGLLILIVEVINALSEAIRSNSGPIMAAVLNLVAAALTLINRITEIIVAPILDLWETIYTDTLLSLESGFNAVIGTALKFAADFESHLAGAIGSVHETLISVIGKSKVLSWLFGIKDPEVEKAKVHDSYQKYIDERAGKLSKDASSYLRKVSMQNDMIVDDFMHIGDILAGKRKGEWRENFEAGMPDYDQWLQLWVENVQSVYPIANSIEDSYTQLGKAVEEASKVVKESDDPKVRAATQKSMDAMASLNQANIRYASTHSGSITGTNMSSGYIQGVMSTFMSDPALKEQLVGGIAGKLGPMLGEVGGNIDYSKFVAGLGDGTFDMANLDVSKLAGQLDISDADASKLADVWNQNGSDIISNLSQGMVDNQGEASDAAGEVGDYSVQALQDTMSDAEKAGHNFTGGFARGIWNNRDVALQNAWMVADRAANELARRLAEHSPSKVTAELGKFFTIGFANGIADRADVAVETTASLAERTTDAFRSSLQTISDAISSDVEANPTIRPVMDLSNVRSSVGSINQMFSAQSAKYAAINSRLTNESAAYKFELDQSSRYDNSDVVSAIGGMQDEMTGLKDAMMDTQIVMDSGVLVGALAPGMDRTLGRMSARKARRN